MYGLIAAAWRRPEYKPKPKHQYVWKGFYQESIDHHTARAAYWRDQGNEEYALGSEKKSEKWRAKQQRLYEFLY
jgi:hypothetical protein